MRGTVEQRFWAKVDVRGPDDCWLWKAGTNDSGYGQIGIGPIVAKATHVSLELDGRPRPDGHCAIHSCDNPPCVNPAHLRWGTNKDNVDDRQAKGRGKYAVGPLNGAYTKPETRPRGDQNGSRTKPEKRPRGDRHWTRTKPDGLHRGDNHYARTKPQLVPRGQNRFGSKLTESDIVEIRRSAEPRKALAVRFGVSKALIDQVINRRCWKHIQ